MQARRHTADTPLCLRSSAVAQWISAKQSRQARAQAFPHMSWGCAYVPVSSKSVLPQSIHPGT